MFRVALKIVFFCKLAKGQQTFNTCQLKTPQGKTLNATKNGEPVIDSETGDVFNQNVRALLELEDGQKVCGLQFDEFSEESFFGWWSCEMSKEAEVFHRGTFKINKPDQWPKEIRLPSDIQVKKESCFEKKNHLSLKIKLILYYLPHSTVT